MKVQGLRLLHASLSGPRGGREGVGNRALKLPRSGPLRARACLPTPPPELPSGVGDRAPRIARSDRRRCLDVIGTADKIFNYADVPGQ